MPKTFTSKQYFSQLNFLYFAQAATMFIFTAVVFGLVYSGTSVPAAEQSQMQMFTYVLLVAVVVGFTAAHFLYRFQVSKLDASIDLRKKLPKYIAILLIRSACMELPALFAGIIFFLTGNYYLLTIPLFTVVVFFLLRPTPQSIAEDLNLSDKERKRIMNPDEVVAER